MWQSLKKLLEGTDRAIIIEEGEPKYIILSVEHYMRLRGQDSGFTSTTTDGTKNSLATPGDSPIAQSEVPITPPVFDDSADVPANARTVSALKSELHSNDIIRQENMEPSEINLDDLPF